MDTLCSPNDCVFSLVICWKHYTHTYETLIKVNVLFVQVYLDVLFIWLVRRQTSEHLNPFRMQSHESSLYAFWHIHDISCITAVGAGSHFIQSITLSSLKETTHYQLAMEHRCFVKNFSISPLDSWLANNAYSSCLGMEGSDEIPLLLNEYMFQNL